MSPGATTAARGRRRTAATRQDGRAAAPGGRSCHPRPSGRPARRDLIGIVAIAVGLLLVALVVPAAGAASDVTALELEAIVGLPVWLVLWPRIRTRWLLPHRGGS